MHEDPHVATDAALAPTEEALTASHRTVFDALGQTVRAVLPQIESFWIETFGEVARSREPARFVEEVQSLRRWFSVYAWSLVPQAQHRCRGSSPT